MNAQMQPAEERLRLGFLGLGWIGGKRIESLGTRPEVELAAFADSDLPLAGRLASNYPGACAAASLEDLPLARLDGLVIATPSGLHEAQVLAALDRGLPVFCQKPLATTGRGVERLLERAVERDCLLGVDFCYRHVAGLHVLREQLRARELGEIFAVDLTFHNAWSPAARWRDDIALAGGGCLLDLGVHLLDLASWLQDFPAMTVDGARLFARGRDLAGQGPCIEDFAVATLRQQQGATVRLACSWNLHAGQGAIIEIALHGTKGGAVLRNIDGSFYDLEVSTLRGDRRELLARDRGGWGPGALYEWLARLGLSGRFDAEAAGYAASANLVDAIYRSAGCGPDA